MLPSTERSSTSAWKSAWKSPWSSERFLLPRRDRDLDVCGWRGQLRHAHCGPCGPRLLEYRRVHGVHLTEQVHVGEIHLNRHDVIKTHSRCLQDDADVVQARFHFQIEISRNLAGLQIAADLARNIQRSIHQNS